MMASARLVPLLRGAAAAARGRAAAFPAARQGLRAAAAQEAYICRRGLAVPASGRASVSSMLSTRASGVRGACRRGLMLPARQGGQHARGGGGTGAGAPWHVPTTCRPRGTIRGSLRAVRGLVDGALGAVRETSCVWTINLFTYCLYATSTGLVALASAAVLANLGPLSFLAVPAGALGVVAIATGVPAGLCALCVATGGSLGALPLVISQINNILDACLSWMPFRGRLLTMVIGMFLGAGGGTATILKYNHDEATLPLGQAEDTCVVTDGTDVDWSAMMCSGSLRRWSTQWPVGWRDCQGEVIPRLLLLGPAEKEGKDDAAEKTAVDLAFSGGPALSAIPLKVSSHTMIAETWVALV